MMTDTTSLPRLFFYRAYIPHASRQCSHTQHRSQFLMFLTNYLPSNCHCEHTHVLTPRDNGSSIAMKTLKQVQKGWGQGGISSLQPQKDDFLDYWDGSTSS